MFALLELSLQWHIASPELPPIVSHHNIAQPVRVSPRVSPVNAQKR